jgi:putative tricarboxylic transport membrane protein
MKMPLKAVPLACGSAGGSGYREFGAMLASGQLRAINVSSRKSSFAIPSVRDQGLQVDMANWRGVFTGQ